VFVHFTPRFLSTYKVIGCLGTKANAPHFIIGGILDNIKHPKKYGLIDFGYIFEKMILYATSLGFGTCWLGGTFHGQEAENELGMKDPHKIVCVTPIGIEA